MSPTQQPTLTVFGATGGCAANAVVAALGAGIKCVALARTPSKLRNMLEDQYTVPPKTLDANLVIIEGNIRSIEDVKRTLTASGSLPDRILFGVGGSPKIQFSLWAPITLDDPHICEEGMKTLIAALRSCEAENVQLGPQGSRPLLFAISTVSMSSRRDLAYLYYPLEYWLLSIPRSDKKALEKVIFEAVLGVDSPVGGFAMVRPPILSEGTALGPDKVKAGWVWPDEQRREKVAKGEKEVGPMVGWFVTKADVGRWIFDNLIQGDGSALGKCWSLTN
ncbi:uncharacterized protein A1O9_07862 [Exophiala aquamarina CBS 119918]|uniref:NAD(P)-binding domain-containing protein n=1 Tax=Exophiala aquamarina CBS 119918 TaxID=1182545 RepID=A0A072P8X4_9EURO|nr:uncharacterized protein A1O9_07862 [Exophiala aquamarina CBS 119918]KEF56281.1 hypothetical protein A1O9_07862 [Exophiala aquamarina CBS 119918]